MSNTNEPNRIKGLLEYIASWWNKKCPVEKTYLRRSLGAPDIFTKTKFKIGDLVMRNSDWPVENRTKWKIETMELVNFGSDVIYFGKVVYPVELAGKNMQCKESDLELYLAAGEMILDKDQQAELFLKAVERLKKNPNLRHIADLAKFTDAWLKVKKEFESATKAYPSFNSPHEGFAVLLEEVEELKAHVWMKPKNRDLKAMEEEAVQVATMAIRFVVDACNEETGRK